MSILAPEVPTSESDFEKTRKYLEYIRVQHRYLRIRDLLGFWGVSGRGKNNVAIISEDLRKMGLQTNPPFDSGPLDGNILIERLGRDEEPQIQHDQTTQHMLLLSKIDSATFAINKNIEGYGIGWVTQDASVSEATTIMLRYDYSQLPVVDSKENQVPIGVFSWESYSKASLAGMKPSKVAGAMDPAWPVDVHSDLFASASRIATDGYVLVTFKGKLSGIVTGSDLTHEFEKLAIPFLAVMRCEQELKRVANGYLTKEPGGADELTLGQVQGLFRDHWPKLGWSLSKDEFDQWMESTRALRNSIAHFDDPDEDRSGDVESVHRLTRWLRYVSTDKVAEMSSDGASKN